MNDYQPYTVTRDKKGVTKLAFEQSLRQHQDTRLKLRRQNSTQHSANCDIIKINHFIWSVLSFLN